MLHIDGSSVGVQFTKFATINGWRLFTAGRFKVFIELHRDLFFCFLIFKIEKHVTFALAFCVKMLFQIYVEVYFYYKWKSTTINKFTQRKKKLVKESFFTCFKYIIAKLIVLQSCEKKTQQTHNMVAIVCTNFIRILLPKNHCKFNLKQKSYHSLLGTLFFVWVYSKIAAKYLHHISPDLCCLCSLNIKFKVWSIFFLIKNYSFD